MGCHAPTSQVAALHFFLNGTQQYIMAGSAVHIPNVSVAIKAGVIPGGFNASRTRFQFPVVSSKSQRGVPLHWRLQVELHAPGDTPVPMTPKMLGAVCSAGAPIDQLPPDHHGILTTEAWQEGGRVRAGGRPSRVTRGKNLGKVNATNVLTQAFRDALGKYNTRRKQVGTRWDVPATVPIVDDDGRAVVPEIHRRPPPMLVTKEGAVGSTVLTDDLFNQGAFAQRKFNGVRIVAHITSGNEVELYSRTSTTYPGLGSIRTAVRRLCEAAPAPISREWLASGEPAREITDAEVAAHSGRAAVYLDGEAYVHGKPLSWISGQARGPGGDLDYCIYDCFFPRAKLLGSDIPAWKRQNFLEQLFALAAASDDGRPLRHVRRVVNYPMKSSADVRAQMAQFVKEGYEGLILRKSSPGYRYSFGNYHSPNVIKIKPIHHAEFRVEGYAQGTRGKDVGALIWVCRVAAADARARDDAHFSVVPKGMSYAERYHVFARMGDVMPGGRTRFDRDFRGRLLTVEFPERSAKTGKPTQAKALVFRTADDGGSGADDPLARLLAEHPVC